MRGSVTGSELERSSHSPWVTQNNLAAFCAPPPLPHLLPPLVCLHHAALRFFTRQDGLNSPLLPCRDEGTTKGQSSASRHSRSLTLGGALGTRGERARARCPAVQHAFIPPPITLLLCSILTRYEKKNKRSNLLLMTLLSACAGHARGGIDWQEGNEFSLSSRCGRNAQ